jgi:hypothetical protein
MANRIGANSRNWTNIRYLTEYKITNHFERRVNVVESACTVFLHYFARTNSFCFKTIFQESSRYFLFCSLNTTPSSSAKNGQIKLRKAPVFFGFFWLDRYKAKQNSLIVASSMVLVSFKFYLAKLSL